MQSVNNISAVLLAAGRSRRMGAFKPLLPFGGVSVAERCVENLRAAGANEIVVVIGHRAEDVRAALAHLEPFVRFALNDDAESEMGVSIARGVEQVATNARAILVALVDQPATPPEAVRSLIEAWSVGARLVVPVWQGRGGHPVLVDLALRVELLNLVRREGLRALFNARREEVVRLNVGSPYVARDMDTWDDYVALHTETFGCMPPERES